MQQLIYLACPYNHADKIIMHSRFDAVTQAAGHLMIQGKIIFSPITHCHPIAQCYELPRSWEFWKSFDEVYIGHSDEMYILTLSGWEDSIGVTSERQMMREQQKPISLLDPIDYTLTLLKD